MEERALLRYADPNTSDRRALVPLTGFDVIVSLFATLGALVHGSLIDSHICHSRTEDHRGRHTSVGEIQSTDDMLKFPFEEANELLDDVDIVDEVMDKGMREYTRLWLLGVTDGIYREMEARREQV